MALARPLSPLWQMLLPATNGPVRPIVHLPLLLRLAQPFRVFPTPFAALAAPTFSLPSLPSWADIWEDILKAVPKKKTSYRKKRQRFMAGKGLKDITSLNKCSACGRVKRAHFLCPYCVDAIKTNIFGNIWWSVRKPTEKQQRHLKHELRMTNRLKRAQSPDPRNEAPVVKHGDWKAR